MRWGEKGGAFSMGDDGRWKKVVEKGRENGDRGSGNDATDASRSTTRCSKFEAQPRAFGDLEVISSSIGARSRSAQASKFDCTRHVAHSERECSLLGGSAFHRYSGDAVVQDKNYRGTVTVAPLYTTRQPTGRDGQDEWERKGGWNRPEARAMLCRNTITVQAASRQADSGSALRCRWLTRDDVWLEAPRGNRDVQRIESR
ncbi:hypothetical protein PVAR5_1307 [Paecilomyces variotii No. 5]|uniref:Uncharacterized protein n=1 Tax=Byssochlamys spectabilis (strain No. 5 / NBRC 109023) TaxID=1356009 RepID=V5F9C5_BYSSN|nr:hypothetical protein PVAR5_1307 [Paecilomyces variotii No. 5]